MTVEMTALTTKVQVSEDINDGLICPSPKYLATLLGVPRATFSDTCQTVTNEALKLMMRTANVGPFRVTGLRPAVESLTDLMADIREQVPEVYQALGTTGMLGCRYMRQKRGSQRPMISSHSWGTAIDLTVAGRLDDRGDGKAQVGLAMIAPIFHRYGWYWGAGFRFEDSMHFEVSQNTLCKWKSAGVLGRRVAAPMQLIMQGDFVVLQRGASGPEVKILQDRLRKLGASLDVDGVFGTRTEIAVTDFQRKRCLVADGVVGPITRKALGFQ